jgi:dolichol-phosphate mannosyltransferase
MKPYYSIIVPVYNEEKNLPELYNQLTVALEILSKPWEIVFVNDGSIDASEQIIKKLVRQDKFVKAIFLSRNFGQQAAITAGLANSSGEIVAIMDADLQDPPEVMLKLFSQLDKGYEVAYGASVNRNDPLIRKFFFNLYYQLMQKFSSYPIPPNAGIFAAMRRNVATSILTMQEQNRFLPAMRAWVGFKQVGVPYEKPNRFAGKENQSFLKLFKMGFDALLSFSNFPLRWATILGIIVSFIAVILIINVLYQKFVTGAAILGWASTLISILFMGAVQLLTIGLIGEYLGRIYDEVKNRPYYIISKKEGF